MIYETVGKRGFIWWGSFAGNVVTQGGTRPCASQCCIQFRPGKFRLLSHLLGDGDEVGCFSLSNLSVDLISECFVQVAWDLDFSYCQLVVVP